MSSLNAKDRVSLCTFTFSDGRRCRTPRNRNNARFCFYHAQKEARARAAQKLGKDLGYFFSGDYLSACDLSAALGRLIPAVVRGDVKPKTAHTVAYLAQTLMQAIHLSKHEYINAFGTEGWRSSVRNSVNGNHDYLFPPAPHRSCGLQAGAPPPEYPGPPQPHPAQRPTPPPPPAPSPHTPPPPPPRRRSALLPCRRARAPTPYAPYPPAHSPRTHRPDRRESRPTWGNPNRSEARPKRSPPHPTTSWPARSETNPTKARQRPSR